MTTTTVFRTNRSQAVRLPKDVAFPPDVKEVRIIRQGKSRVIVPVDSSWDEFFASPGIDFPDREPQGTPQEREPL